MKVPWDVKNMTIAQTGIGISEEKTKSHEITWTQVSALIVSPMTDISGGTKDVIFKMNML